MLVLYGVRKIGNPKGKIGLYSSKNKKFLGEGVYKKDKHGERFEFDNVEVPTGTPLYIGYIEGDTCLRCGMSKKDLRKDYCGCSGRGRYYGRHKFK